MVKIRNVFGDEYKGRQGNAVYQKFYGRQIRRLWDGRKENRAPGQEEQKRRFRVGLAFWESLSTAEREKLREYLREIGSDLTAQQWAVKVALSRPRVVVQSEEVLANLLMWKEDWDAIGWHYRQKLTITNNTATDLTDFQVRLELDASKVGDHFRWDLLGADLRFYDEAGNKLAYWVETWDIQNKQATVWVKVSSIKANSSATVKMYYGNAQAESESDGEAVFEFFDDFDTADYTMIRGSSSQVSVSNGWIRIDATSGYSSAGDIIVESNKQASISGDFIVEIRAYLEKPNEFVGIFAETGGQGYLCGWYGWAGEKGAIMRWDGWDNKNILQGEIPHYVAPAGSTQILRWDRANSELRLWDTDGSNVIATQTDTTYNSFSKVAIRLYKGGIWQVDWIRVRKFTEQEPGVEFGAEEQGQVVTHRVTTVTVKAIEHPAIQDVRVFDEQGSEIWRAEGLTNIMEGKVTSRVRLPDEVTEKGVTAIVRSIAGTVNIVHL